MLSDFFVKSPLAAKRLNIKLTLIFVDYLSVIICYFVLNNIDVFALTLTALNA